MAQFDIERESLANPERWPDRCARCGASGTSLVAVPASRRKKLDPFSVPLCEMHADDWDAVYRRTWVALFLWLVAIAGSMLAMWLLQPQVAKPFEQNEASRWSFTIVLGLIGSLPFGGLLAWWAKPAIRVAGTYGRFATIAGVCRVFAAAMTQSDPSAVRESGDTPRFEVQPYAPRPHVPMNRATNALAILFTLAAALGAGLALGGRELESSLAGWDRNDGRYAALACGLVLAYTLPLIGLRALSTRFGCMVVFGILVLMAPVLIACRLAGSVRFAFLLAYSLPPLVLLQFLAQRLIWRWKLRSTPIAVAAGAGSGLGLVAVALIFGGSDQGPHQAVYPLGLFVAVIGGVLARSHATSPYCLECDGWLECRRLGAFPKSLAEMQPLVADGGIVALAEVKPYDETAAIGDTELKAYACPECRDCGTVVLELFDCVKGGKNGQQPIVKAIGRWQYPGTALPALQAIFPPLAVSNGGD
ncbi:MAG: hypothetical protein U0791_27095 [Gemmataceae bacterium]